LEAKIDKKKYRDLYKELAGFDISPKRLIVHVI